MFQAARASSRIIAEAFSSIMSAVLVRERRRSDHGSRSVEPVQAVEFEAHHTLTTTTSRKSASTSRSLWGCHAHIFSAFFGRSGARLGDGRLQEAQSHSLIPRSRHEWILAQTAEECGPQMP